VDDESVLSRTPPPADVRLAYGPDPLHFVDVRLPRGKGPHPALLFIHGGFWRAKYDLLHAGHLSAAFAEAGLVTFNLEYRRVGNPGGGWPGSFEDVTKAFNFLLGVATKYQIDKKRIAVMGHSAGGQLALCLADHQRSLRAAVSLAGVLDLGKAYELHLSNDAVVGYLGGTPGQVSDHYREASPIELTVSKHIHQVVIHGKQDEVVPVAISRDYVRAKKKKDENVKLVEIDDCGHFEVIDPQAKQFAHVKKGMLDALA